MTAPSFSSLSLRAELLNNLPTLGYHTMTPVQAHSLPAILAGRDLLAQAQTGSGKTAAFGLGLLQRLDPTQLSIQGLVLCPTRELADQVANELRRLARGLPNIKVLTLCGGQPFGPQIASLEQGAHLLVGTPGRIEDHLRRTHLDLQQLKILVLDEADRMLDMGFSETLDAILAATPAQRQTLMLSATFADAIRTLATASLRDPLLVEIETEQAQPKITQHFYRLPKEQQRFAILQALLLQRAPEMGIIFCTTRQETQQLAEALSQAGFSALPLHGDLEQRDRDQTLIQFAHRSANLLVATDVAARGLDIANLDLVVNYQLAQDPEAHVHRIGRTGRAGAEGVAISLVGPEDERRLDAIRAVSEQACTLEALPATPAASTHPAPAPMKTLVIDGGKKDKLRPGDILGALTACEQLGREQIGKITITPRRAYVSIERSWAKTALDHLNQGKLKGRNFRVRYL
ncbi:ATP-dependent RNA helicase DbpA [Marinospirillum sp. MEB164]|uniref:ATP-dependent RNA helicase DbpA n=1 Tax=Marinospirillum alkalitolerans TaxID=3123374 RepID=A0ABW8PUZ1_9GAMM